MTTAIVLYERWDVEDPFLDFLTFMRDVQGYAENIDLYIAWDAALAFFQGRER